MPLTAASLLKPPRHVTVDQKSGGDYAYFGLEKLIHASLSKLPVNCKQNLKIIELHVNIDGLPLFKSSALSLWPIQCLLAISCGLLHFVVALYCGVKNQAILIFI